MKNRISIVVLFLFCLHCICTSALAVLKKEDVEVFKLDNGLKVLLLEDHDIPNIAMYTFFRVGSRNEYTGLTGVSHFIEHMMFNGTEKIGPGEFDRNMEFMGGSNNAYTGRDMTAYTDWFPASALEPMIQMEADRMQGAIFDSKVLESERGVVAEERRLTTDNRNEALLEEQVVASAITAHPYHWDVIGWMSDIQNWKREAILDYYHTYYAPNNAVLILVGDFKTEDAIGLIKKYYSPIKPGPPSPAVHTTEPPQLGEKRVNMVKEAQTPCFIMVYHSPECTNPEFYPMSVIESAMLDGKSSRLYQRLVREEQLAIDVYGGIYETIDPFLFSFYVKPRPGTDLGKIEKIIEEELEKIKKEGISSRELQKAVNNIKSGFYNRLQTIAGKANLLGRYEILYGDFAVLFDQIKNYERLTPEQIKKAANRYFTDKNKTVGKLIPEGGTK